MTRGIALLAATLLWLGVRSAFATVVLELPTADLAQRSQTIVRGVVIGQKAGWDSKHEHIVTRIKVRVEETLRGTVRARQQITVQQAGGEVDGVGQRIEGAASFHPGEEVLLFLEPHRGSKGEHSLVSMAASKYSVVRDASGAHVQRDLSGITFVRRDATGKLKPVPTEPEKPVALTELRTTIRQALATHR